MKKQVLKCFFNTVKAATKKRQTGRNFTNHILASYNCLLLRNQTAQAMVYIIWFLYIYILSWTPCRQEKTDTFQRQMDMFCRKEITDRCCLHRCDISKPNVGKKMYVLEVSTCVVIYRDFPFNTVSITTVLDLTRFFFFEY